MRLWQRWIEPGGLPGSYTVSGQYAFSPTPTASGLDSRAAFSPASRSAIVNGADVARFDYSRAALATLGENSLDESVGIGAGTNDITTYNCPDRRA